MNKQASREKFYLKTYTTPVDGLSIFTEPNPSRTNGLVFFWNKI